MLPEAARSSDDVLPQATLRLVHAERGPTFERRAVVRLADALLVEGVTGFVHRAEQQAERQPLDPARRDPDVV